MRSRIWILTTFLLALSARAVDYPPSRAGQAARAWIEAYRAGDVELRGWVEKWRDKASLERTSVDQRMARYQQLRQIAGELEADRILSFDDYSCSLLLRNADGSGWFEIRFTIEQGVPYKVTELAFAPSSPPADAGPLFGGYADIQELAQKAREAAVTPAIALALFEDGELVAAAADGVIASDAEDPVQIDMPFHIGSISKSFTGVLIARLVERGKLHWEDRLDAVLPGFSMRDEYRAVSIAQLLRHRGAIPAYTLVDDDTAAELAGLGQDPRSARAAFVARILGETPDGEVDAAMSYSNGGFAILGHVAERVDGRDWEQQIRDEIFAPLGMESGGFGWPADAAHPGNPRGHHVEGDALRPQALDDPYRLEPCLAPAGDLRCNAADLARYGAMHLAALRGESGLLSADIVRALHDPGPYENGSYAGGWVIDPDGHHWHNGSAGTFYAVLKLDPERNRVATVLFNVMSPRVQSLGGAIVDALLEGIPAGEAQHSTPE